MPTANELQKISLYLKGALDKKMTLTSLTSRFDVANDKLKPTGVAGTYLYPQLSIATGLKNYAGKFDTNASVKQEWKPFTCNMDRAQRIIIDPVEDAQAAGVAIANAASVFMEQHVIPEIDAVRFAAYANGAGTKVQKTLTADNIEEAYLDALEALADAEYPTDSLTIFVTPHVNNLFKKLYRGSRYLTATEAAVGTKIDTIDGHPIVEVPASRFNTGIELSANGGYEIQEDTGIEMLIVSNRSVLQITDHLANRVFSPDVFQDANAWAWDYRVFHGVHVVDNQKKGIYCITKEA